jgi:hypothetical protein
MAVLLLTSASGCNPFQGGQSDPPSTHSAQATPPPSPSSSESGAGGAGVAKEVKDKLEQTRSALDKLRSKLPEYENSQSFYSDALSKVKDDFETNYQSLISSLDPSVKSASDVKSKSNQISTATKQVSDILQLLTKPNFQEAQNKLIELRFLGVVNQDNRPNNDGNDGPATRKATIDLLKNWAGVKASLSNQSLYKSSLDVAKSLGELETSIINNRTKPTRAGARETPPPEQSVKSGDRPASSLINWTILFLLLGALSSLSVLTLWILFQFNNRRIFIRVEEPKQDDNRPRGKSSFKTLYSLVREIEKSNNEIEKICQGITEIKKANKNGILDGAALFKLQEKLSSLDDIREEINRIFLETVCKLNSHSEQVELVSSNEQLQQLINDMFYKIQGQINSVSQSFNPSSLPTNNQVHNIATQISSLSSRFQQDISQLSEKISDLIQLNNSQPDKVNQYEQQINFLTEQSNQYQEQHRFLAKHNQTLTETISSLEEEIKHLNQNRSSFSGTDSDLSVKIQALQQQVDNLKRQLAEEKTNKQEAESNLTELSQQNQSDPARFQELEGQISGYRQEIKQLKQQKSELESINNVCEHQVIDLGKQLTKERTEKQQYEDELAKLKIQNSNLAADKSRLERHLDSLSPASPSAHLPPQVAQLVGLFNHNPELLLNNIAKYYEVSETRQSSSGRRGSVDSKDVLLETPETNIGDFWIVETDTGSSYLFPKQKAISAGLAQTAKALFKGYRGSDTTPFELLRPAKVSSIGRNWKLDEQGELKYTN